MQKCPQCGLINPSGGEVCDCGQRLTGEVLRRPSKGIGPLAVVFYCAALLMLMWFGWGLGGAVGAVGGAVLWLGLMLMELYNRSRSRS